jgi:hypothetical protein
MGGDEHEGNGIAEIREHPSPKTREWFADQSVIIHYASQNKWNADDSNVKPNRFDHVFNSVLIWTPSPKFK